MRGIRYRIGIDTGATTGLAVWDEQESGIVHFESGDFWTAYERVQEWPNAETLVVIECPNANRRIFWDKRKHVSEDDIKVRLQIAKDVGRIGMEAALLADGLERIGYRVERRAPSGKKWDKVALAQQTGITDRTNEHVRDAIRFVWPVVHRSQFRRKRGKNSHM